MGRCMTSSENMVLEIHKEETRWAVTAYRGRRVFGFVKREDREDALLQAVMMVLNVYPQAQLELVGDPNDEEDLL